MYIVYIVFTQMILPTIYFIFLRNTKFYPFFIPGTYFAGIETRVLDVTKTEDVKAFAATIEKIDILFNVAG